MSTNECYNYRYDLQVSVLFVWEPVVQLHICYLLLCGDGNLEIFSVFGVRSEFFNCHYFWLIYGNGLLYSGNLMNLI